MQLQKLNSTSVIFKHLVHVRIERSHCDLLAYQYMNTEVWCGDISSLLKTLFCVAAVVTP
uniref:Uncharacterized protein n=1 Tax=Anguilla anguilla TaxID=7936 RepID=A0A0E9TRC5_ANGAN